MLVESIFFASQTSESHRPIIIITSRPVVQLEEGKKIHFAHIRFICTLPRKQSATRATEPAVEPSATMVPILSTQWEVRAIAGEPKAVVRVRNLQAIVQGGTDAWGRPGKAQPALISAEISFIHPFGTVCSNDRLSAETVHYGKLSKAILEAIDDLNSEPAPTPSVGQPSPSDAPPTMKDVLDMIWARLTGLPVDGNAEEFSDSRETPFLNLQFIRFMSIKLTFPKASLLGEGVSLTASTLYGPFAGGYGCVRYALSLRLCNLKVPTLIGVNPNERHNKQFVVADIELDNFICLEDMYTGLERGVVAVRRPKHGPCKYLANHT